MNVFEIGRLVASWFAVHVGGLHDMLEGGVLHVAPALFYAGIFGGMAVGFAEIASGNGNR